MEGALKGGGYRKLLLTIIDGYWRLIGGDYVGQRRERMMAGARGKGSPRTRWVDCAREDMKVANAGSRTPYTEQTGKGGTHNADTT